MSVNKKRVHRLMKEQGLIVTERTYERKRQYIDRWKIYPSDIDEIIERLQYFKRKFRSWDFVAGKLDINKRSMFRWIKTKKMSKHSYKKLNYTLRKRGKIKGRPLSRKNYAQIMAEEKEDLESVRIIREAKEKLGIVQDS